MNPNTRTPTTRTSVWLASASLPQFPQLNTEVQADVCIVGAGIAGLTTAYLLLRSGKTVTVIDADGIGAGETGRSTAHFFPPDERYFEIENSFGTEQAILVADAYRKATDCVESIIRSERIECDFERLDGFLFSPAPRWDDTLEQEYAVTTRLGLNVRRLERVPGLSFDTGPCLRFANQAQFHPLKYLQGLSEAIVRMGGQIYGSTRALDISGNSGRHTVRTGAGSISAQSVVVATNIPFNEPDGMQARQTGYLTYVVAVRMPKDALPRMQLWETGEPYHYVRLAAAPGVADYELLIVGGQDHKSAEPADAEERYGRIEEWIGARFPLAGQVEYRWSGQIMEPADGAPFLGRNRLDHDNLYVITGDSGNGMTHCTVGALLISDLILGRKSDWSALYDPSRKAFHGIGDFITAQATTRSQYTDWLRGGDVESVDEIGAGEGAVIRNGGKLLAVYRDPDGALQAVSAACTHLGCAVHWNSGEKCWDCPCHGSRFAADGAVLHGPARRPLAAATLTGGDGSHPPDAVQTESRP